MNSTALTLGRAKGAVFLGQSLTLTVPVQLEAGDSPSAQCFDADVFYGDSRQDAGRVSVNSTLQPLTQSTQVVISSLAPVDEPVVTVYLRAGCENRTQRRYVMLVEVAPTVVPPPLSAGAVADTLPAVPQSRVSEKAAVRVSRAATATPPTAPATAGAPLPQRAQPATAAKLVTKPPLSDARRARLKLVPLDLAPEPDSLLRLTDTLSVDGGEDLQKRARAAALWRSLNATPQDAQEAESRRQALEADLKGLQAITTKNRQLLDDMTRRLVEAQTGRYSNPLVFGLLAFLLLSGLAIAVLRSRAARGMRSGAPWWRDETLGGGSETVGSAGGLEPKGESAAPARAHGSRATAPAPQPAQASRPRSPQPLASDEPRAPTVATPLQPASRAAGHVDFGHSMSATLLRSVNSKEMLDVRQQAEFFMTLGQHEEAIALLRDSVDAGAEANPLVALELLKVLHTLGRKAEYDHYRHGFNAIFNGHVPAYADFSQSGSGLEAYPPVCQRIVALWPSEDAVAYIETCLVRTRKGSGGQDFDLEAFRDLLMLHGVASRIASTSFDSGFMAFSAAKTAPIPVSAAANVGVDLDLSETHDGNLIDFDASGWSPPASESVKGNGR